MKENNEGTLTETFDRSRRRFLKVMTVGLGTLVGIALGIPFIGAIVGKSSTLKKMAMARVIEVSYLTLGQPVRENFLWQNEDAYIHETVVQSVWVVEHSSSEATVFSPICPHAGCYYNWDSEARQFHCPCHGSVFSMDGKVLGGPAPRPLDTLPHKIQDGVLFVKWERFKSGTSEKIQIS
jgi:menaquinol-cytochrome c reductase iron-sulfur subunit